MTYDELKKKRGDYLATVSTETALCLEYLYHDFAFKVSQWQPIIRIGLEYAMVAIENELFGSNDEMTKTWKDIGRKL